MSQCNSRPKHGAAVFASLHQEPCIPQVSHQPKAKCHIPQANSSLPTALKNPKRRHLQ